MHQLNALMAAQWTPPPPTRRAKSEQRVSLCWPAGRLSLSLRGRAPRPHRLQARPAGGAARANQRAARPPARGARLSARLARRLAAPGNWRRPGLRLWGRVASGGSLRRSGGQRWARPSVAGESVAGGESGRAWGIERAKVSGGAESRPSDCGRPGCRQAGRLGAGFIDHLLLLLIRTIGSPLVRRDQVGATVAPPAQDGT